MMIYNSRSTIGSRIPSKEEQPCQAEIVNQLMSKRENLPGLEAIASKDLGLTTTEKRQGEKLHELFMGQRKSLEGEMKI